MGVTFGMLGTILWINFKKRKYCLLSTAIEQYQKEKSIQEIKIFALLLFRFKKFFIFAGNFNGINANFDIALV